MKKIILTLFLLIVLQSVYAEELKIDNPGVIITEEHRLYNILERQGDFGGNAEIEIVAGFVPTNEFNNNQNLTVRFISWEQRYSPPIENIEVGICKGGYIGTSYSELSISCDEKKEKIQITKTKTNRNWVCDGLTNRCSSGYNYYDYKFQIPPNSLEKNKRYVLKIKYLLREAVLGDLRWSDSKLFNLFITNPGKWPLESYIALPSPANIPDKVFPP